jgi:hypothetical protein
LLKLILLARASRRTLMAYRVRGIAPQDFDPLFNLPDEELKARGIERVIVAAKPGAPCRICLDDAEIGETVLLLNYLHQPALTPYRQQGPIFVRHGFAAFDAERLGPALMRRPLSLRAFDSDGSMIDADLAEGGEIEPAIEAMLARPAVAYVHAHYAKRGCYAARIERA